MKTDLERLLGIGVERVAMAAFFYFVLLGIHAPFRHVVPRTQIPDTLPDEGQHPLAQSTDPTKAKAHQLSRISGLFKTGRGERIRTSGLYVPNVALYQAKLHPEVTIAV